MNPSSVRRISFFVLILLSLTCVQAQPASPQGPNPPQPLAQPSIPPPAISRPVNPENASKAALVFSVRSAFSLSPAMLATLTSSGSSGSSAASGAARTESALPQKADSVAWTEPLVRELPYTAPLDLRLVGKNVVALIQIVPMEAKGRMVDLFIQGQVWVQKADGTLAFNTSIQTMSLALGSRLFFYPLGVDQKNGAPIAVEIRVDPSPAK